MPSTAAIGNKDNYIKQPFEIPLEFGWLVVFGLGLGDEGGLMHCFASCNGRRDRQTSHCSGRDYGLRWTALVLHFGYDGQNCLRLTGVGFSFSIDI